jgi:hypothetical protein
MADRTLNVKLNGRYWRLGLVTEAQPGGFTYLQPEDSLPNFHTLIILPGVLTYQVSPLYPFPYRL